MENNIYAYRYFELNRESFLYYRFYNNMVSTRKELKKSLEMIVYLVAYQLKKEHQKTQHFQIYLKKYNNELIKLSCDLKKSSNSEKYLLFHILQLVKDCEQINMPLIMVAVQIKQEYEENMQLSLW